MDKRRLLTTWSLLITGVLFTQPLMAAIPLATENLDATETVVIPAPVAADADALTMVVPESADPLDEEDDTVDEESVALEDAEVTTAMSDNDKTLGEIDKD